MNMVENFVTEFFKFINALPSWQGILTLVLVLLIFVMSPQIKNGFISFFKKYFKKRSCGDCVLIIFGISEKYKNSHDKIIRNLLNKKMTYFEQKIEFIVLELLKKYKDLQLSVVEENKQEYTSEYLNKEFWGYKHAIINALDLQKKEIRRTFLENGFHDYDDREFSDYVKEKVMDLISIMENFLMNDYPEDNIISLDDLFNNFDKNWYQDIIFDIYIRAKDIQKNADNELNLLDENFKKDIDKLIKDKK